MNPPTHIIDPIHPASVLLKGPEANGLVGDCNSTKLADVHPTKAPYDADIMFAVYLQNIIITNNLICQH